MSEPFGLVVLRLWPTRWMGMSQTAQSGLIAHLTSKV